MLEISNKTVIFQLLGTSNEEMRIRSKEMQMNSKEMRIKSTRFIYQICFMESALHIVLCFSLDRAQNAQTSRGHLLVPAQIPGARGKTLQMFMALTLSIIPASL